MGRLVPNPQPEVDWISRAEAGRRFGVSSMMVSKYCNAMGAPSREDGKVPWPAIKEWRERYIVPERSGSWAHRQRTREEAGERAGHGVGERGEQESGQGTGQRIKPVGTTAFKAAGSPAAGSIAAGPPVGSGSVPGTAAGAAARAAAKVNGHAAAQFESLAQATVRDKIAAANLRELEYARQKGELVEWAAVKLWVWNMVIEAGDGILRVPAEWRDRLAAESDPVLDGALRRVLERLAQRAATAPAEISRI